MLTAPYNFVPLSNRIFYPDWAENVSMDKPFKDGEDGIIELTLTNRTPFFTRNGSQRNVEEQYSSSMIDANGIRHYFIPGTTLKGCVRSVLECLSFAKMGAYNKSYFGMVRDFDTKKTDNKPFIEAMKTVCCGWLQKVDEDYYVSICKRGIQKIHHDDLQKKFTTFDKGKDHETAERKQTSLMGCGHDELFPVISVADQQYFYTVNKNKKSVPQGEYRIVCTGYMEGKSHEYLFSEEQETPVKISREVFLQFDSVHSNSAYYAKHGEAGFLKSLLSKGHQIPVFFIKNEKGEIISMGITRMYRLPYTNGVEKAIENCVDGKIEYDRKDLPEVMFGSVGDISVRGRVSFGHAFCDEIILDNELIVKKGVLGQPSASYYPLYLQQTTAPYVTYANSELKVAGRKRYRIIAGDQTNALPAGNGNEKVGVTFKALPVGKTFHCKVAIHNLRKAEIGALLSAITFHNTPGTFLNLGLAKSFGFGKMEVSVTLGQTFKFGLEEYLREFEVALAHENLMLGGSESINKLISIASEHDGDEMQMMKDPKVYGQEKKNDNFSTLCEKKRGFKPLLSAEEVHSIYEEYNKERIKRELEEKKRQEALSMKTKVLSSSITDVLSKINDLSKTIKAASLNKGKDAISMYEMALSQSRDLVEKQTEIEDLVAEISQLGKSLKVEKFVFETPEEIQEVIENIKNEIGTPVAVSISDSLSGFKGKGVGKLFEYIGKEIKGGATVSESDVEAIAEKCIEQISNNCKKQQDRDRWKDEAKWKNLAEALQSAELEKKVFEIVISKI